jgi:hypothetical protein
MNSTGRINNLVNPSTAQDAATKSYVDSIISYNGTGSLFPTVERADTDNSTHYLTFIHSGDVPSSNSANKRALLRCDINGPTYNPSTNTLTAEKFSGYATSSGILNPPSGSSSGIVTNGSYRMYVTTDGDIGVGTITPSVKLDVNGIVYPRTGLKLGNNSTTTMSSNSLLDINDTLVARARYFCGTNTLTLGMSTVESFFWNESNTRMAFGTNETRRMVITADGKVGIGTESPDCPLHVAIGTSVNLGASNLADGSTFRTSSGFLWNFSIRAQFNIRVGGDIVWNSDKRIKKNVKDIVTGIALTQIRQIRPKIYNYIDYNTKGYGNVYGFIAQDVKEVILHSTICTKDYIPNFYCKGNIYIVDVGNNTYKITSENELVFEKVIDNNGNEVIHFKVKIYGYDNSEYICTVLEVINPKTIVVKLEKEYTIQKVEENKIFIYGQEINDFHSLEKNAIFTVATAALQEVDRQQQADKVRIAELENHVSNLEATVAQQQSLINDILERLKTLEKV